MLWVCGTVEEQPLCPEADYNNETTYVQCKRYVVGKNSAEQKPVARGSLGDISVIQRFPPVPVVLPVSL